MNEQHHNNNRKWEEGTDDELTKPSVSSAQGPEEGPPTGNEPTDEVVLEQRPQQSDEGCEPGEAAEPDDETRYAADTTIIESIPVIVIKRDQKSGEATASGIVVGETEDIESTASEATDEEVRPSAESEERQPEHAEAPCSRVCLKAGTDEQSLRALAICREKAKQFHLRMRPLAARWEGDKHVIIFFRSEEKVDFRKLVRELSRQLHARIELRQVGPREQGKLCGLVGKCGYPLCCRTFLGPLTQSSIKMAKTQELALNPMKISGVCGRLLCCLNYEQQMYVDAKSHMPKVNRIVDTEFGKGRVIAVNVLKGTISVQLETMVKELRPDEVQISESHG